MHRVSSPWLKLLSAVGVILIMDTKPSAQHSRRDNHNGMSATYAVDTRRHPPITRRNPPSKSSESAREGRVSTA